MTLIAKEDDRFVLTYDLLSLPTAQHKAGLAGLMLVIDSLKQRMIEPLPTVDGLSPTGVRISITRDSLQTIFDDLYDSEWEEVSSKAKWQGKEPKRIVEIEVQPNGKTKREKRFVYDAVRPKGVFLQTSNSRWTSGSGGFWGSPPVKRA